ncbi:hypothetical protein N7527_005983 [Penicillium freii]|nr:hypothetical protein N7527_005983 [Penicillium freii]
MARFQDNPRSLGKKDTVVPNVKPLEPAELLEPDGKTQIHFTRDRKEIIGEKGGIVQSPEFDCNAWIEIGEIIPDPGRE